MMVVRFSMAPPPGSGSHPNSTIGWASDERPRAVPWIAPGEPSAYGGRRPGGGAGAMLLNRTLTPGVGAIAIVALAAGPAAARSNPTVTETCTSGIVITVDHHAVGGL